MAVAWTTGTDHTSEITMADTVPIMGTFTSVGATTTATTVAITYTVERTAVAGCIGAA